MKLCGNFEGFFPSHIAEATSCDGDWSGYCCSPRIGETMVAFDHHVVLTAHISTASGQRITLSLTAGKGTPHYNSFLKWIVSAGRGLGQKDN